MLNINYSLRVTVLEVKEEKEDIVLQLKHFAILFYALACLLASAGIILLVEISVHKH